MTEAQLYEDVRLPALMQSLDDLRGELREGLALKATLASGRVVGAVRARFDDGILHVGRLTGAPHQQGKGIGSALLLRVERDAPAGTKKCALITHHPRYFRDRDPLSPMQPADLRPILHDQHSLPPALD